MLLNVQELCVSYLTKKTELKAVDHVSFGIERGDTLGIIGESGSGKSTIVMAMLRQLDPRFSKITGRVEFDGQDLLTLPDAEYQAVAVANSSGDCTVSGISVSTLSLDLDYGDLTAKNTEVQNLCKVKNDAGDINLTDFSCGSSEMELEYGDLKLKKFTETDKTKSSAFTLSDGDVRCETSTLWNSSFDMDFGDIQTTDTALYGNTAISMDYGDVRLNLHGSNADYNVGYSYAAGSLNGSSPNQIAITGDQTLMDSSVTFTE